MARNSYSYRLFGFLRDLPGWIRSDFVSPSPSFIKRRCLIRHGVADATWVETGTFKGQTTSLLAGHGRHVYTIEPEPTLFRNAQVALARFPNVDVLNGTSESVFPGLLPKITGDVNFWLDGHYSAGRTFKGPKDTPIAEELDCILQNIGHFGKVTICVDDVRCFDPTLAGYEGYPPLDFLVDWARQNGFSWQIEQDIFFCKNH